MAQEKEMDNLSRDMIQCKKDGYGCHYGHWKAAQTAVQIPKKPEVMGIETNICSYCGCEFVSSDNRYRKYCGERCRKLGNAKIARERHINRKNTSV